MSAHRPSSSTAPGARGSPDREGVVEDDRVFAALEHVDAVRALAAPAA